MNTALLVFMLVNGHPQGQTMVFHTVGDDCRNELQIIAGINQANARNNTGTRLEASCEPCAVGVHTTPASVSNSSSAE